MKLRWHQLTNWYSRLRSAVRWGTDIDFVVLTTRKEGSGHDDVGTGILDCRGLLPSAHRPLSGCPVPRDGVRQRTGTESRRQTALGRRMLYSRRGGVVCTSISSRERKRKSATLPACAILLAPSTPTTVNSAPPQCGRPPFSPSSPDTPHRAVYSQPLPTSQSRAHSAGITQG